MKTLCENSQPMQRFTMESVMKTLCENSQPMLRVNMESVMKTLCENSQPMPSASNICNHENSPLFKFF